MKFYKAGEIDNSYLEIDQEIDPVNVVKISHYKRLNYFADFIQKHAPDKIEQYLVDLESFYTTQVKKDYISKSDLDIDSLTVDFEHLKKKPELAKLILNFLLQELQLKENDTWVNEKLTVSQRNFLRGLLIPRYNNLLVLTKLLGREKAINIYKIYRSEYRKATDNPEQEPFENLLDFKKKYFDGKELDGTEVIYSDVINGKFFYKKTNCIWNEAVKELHDKELRYYALCYGDYQGATFWNDSFILTMKHTVANDDDYCSCVLHDTRVDWDLTHPSEEFWDSMLPIKKRQKKPKKKGDSKFQQEFQQQFQQLGFYAPETLDILQEVQPLDIAKKSSFNRLNYLLGFIKRNKPEKYNEFVENLEKTYASLSKVDYYNNNNQKLDIKEVIEEFDILNEHKQLAVHSLNYFLGLLDIPSNTNWVNENVKVPKGNFFRSFLIPRYQNVKILANTIERKEAVKLYKIYRTEHAKISTPEDRRYRFATLEDLRKDDFDDYEGEGNPGWVRIEGIVENGKFVYRKDSCLYAEAMKDYPDKEFKYLAACYYDFQGTLIQWNKNFILTMDHTIAEGDPYCSCVVHDTRIDWDLTHPPKEYWDDIWPLQEWQKKSD